LETLLFLGNIEKKINKTIDGKDRVIFPKLYNVIVTGHAFLMTFFSKGTVMVNRLGSCPSVYKFESYPLQECTIVYI
jgi:hypothetical protein